MKYLICQEWENTSNNHAGMKHMCQLLKKKYPDDYIVIVFPALIVPKKFNNFFKKICSLFLRNILIPYKYKKIGKSLAKEIKENDEVYLLEYCTATCPQLTLARYLRRKCNNIKIYGLVHLVPRVLESSLPQKKINFWIEPLDQVLTLGRSLSNYFINELNVSKGRVRTLFHYVDSEYYKPIENNGFSSNNKRLRVLSMGNQERNFDLLHKIVSSAPEIHFTICQGVINLKKRFENCHNVELIGYVNEEQLLSIMQKSDISLNVMKDTIGSNVITTSMSVGLAMVVSDVGSIRDYCYDGAVYCKNDDINSFVNGLRTLLKEPRYLDELKAKSLINSKRLSIHEFNKCISDNNLNS
nr:glycosyltransferase family 4 protein [uncultured Desulfobacter sp.]